MNSAIFLSLLFAHIVGDFYLQTDALCEQKREKKLNSWFLYFHACSIGLLSWLFVPTASFGWWALALAGSHLIIDSVKIYAPAGLWTLVIDQIMHIAVIFGISILFVQDTILPIQIANGSDYLSIPRLLLVVLCCIKPANILIKLTLKSYEIGESDKCNDIKNAGALIGNLERILTVAFVLIGEFAAIGFIIAAKSLLRFKDTDTAKTEYVLAGTLLSFGIAILGGLLAKM